MKIDYSKIPDYLINAFIIILALVGLYFFAQLSMRCDVTIKTEYPFCNSDYNYTIHDANFYTIQYIRDMYGADFFDSWRIDNCMIKLPKRESVKVNLLKPNFKHYDDFYNYNNEVKIK